MRPQKYVQARLTLKRDLYSAAANGQLPDGCDPDSIAVALAPFCEEIEASARSEIEVREAELDVLRKELEAERTERRAEQRAYKGALRQVRQDAAALIENLHQEPLEDPAGCYVYYLWSRDGALLYIGQSTNIYARLGDHMSNPRRRPHVARISVTRCPNGAAMTRLELLAIQQNAPLWNVAGVM